MLVKGVSAEQVRSVISDISDSRYNRNITVKSISDLSSSRTLWTRFTLRTVDSSGKGARGSVSQDGNGPNGTRRTLAACWHAHYDVLQELFNRYPDARVDSSLGQEGNIRYTAGNFVVAAWATQYRNVGSMVRPTYPTELCECFSWRPVESVRQTG